MDDVFSYQEPPALHMARARTMHWLAGELAAHHDAPLPAVQGALASFSTNLSPMLDTPQGVTALGAIAASLLPCINPVPFVATIH